VKSAASPVISWKDRSLQSPGKWEGITYDDFEASFGNFGTVPLTRDAKRDSDSRYASQGSFSAMIRDNAGAESSVFHVANHDVTQYSDLRVEFSFYARGLKGDEDFFLEYSSNGGNEWVVVKQYVVDQDFSSDQFTKSQVVFSQQGSFLFTATGKIRFRCDAEDNFDRVYIDEVRFEGLLSSVEPKNTPIQAPSPPSSSLPTSTPSLSPSVAPSSMPTQSSEPTNESTIPLTRKDICPLDRRNVPAKYEILPYIDTNTTDKVEDDLAEISYLAFSEQADENGNRFAYAASDKEQFSLKVIQFKDNVFASHLNGLGKTVATYTLNLLPPTNDDWEDISLGPCTDSNDSSAYTTDQVCIYIGNTGNNPRANYLQRKKLKIFKFVEPTIVNFTPENRTVDVATIEFEYGAGFAQGDATYHDCKSLVVSLILVSVLLFVIIIIIIILLTHPHIAPLDILYPSRGHVCRLGWCFW
jgi:hypothetical protein